MQKDSNPRELIGRASPIIELYFELNQLKNIYRTGYLDRGLSKEKCESVADHSLSVALLSLIIADEHFQELDTGKIVKIAIIHDVPEVYIGDLTPFEILPEEKTILEYKAFERIFSKMRNYDYYLSLFKEYKNQSSKEAVLVYQVDKLERFMQAKIYEKRGYIKNDFDIDKIYDTKVREILDEVSKL